VLRHRIGLAAMAQPIARQPADYGEQHRRMAPPLRPGLPQKLKSPPILQRNQFGALLCNNGRDAVAMKRLAVLCHMSSRVGVEGRCGGRLTKAPGDSRHRRVLQERIVAGGFLLRPPLRIKGENPALAHSGQSLLPLAREVQQQLEDVDEVQVERESTENSQLLARFRVEILGILFLDRLRVPGG